MSNHHSTTITTAARRGISGHKVLISLGVVGAAAAVAGLGTFGTFSSTTSGSESVASGTVFIALGGGTGGVNNLTIPATIVVPGDTIARAVTLANTGTADLAGVTLTTAATTSSLLDNDTTNGLQLKIDSCTVAWTQATTTAAATCTGTTTSVVATKAVLGANTVVATTRALIAGASDNLLVTLTLPTLADNTFQGKSSVIGFSFTGIQRAVTNR